jgi:hypothetical protein
MICYEKVIKRNKIDPTSEAKYHFPFIIFSTKDNNQHIECLFEDSEVKQKLFIGTEQGFEVMGDIDLFLENKKY